MNTTTSNNCTTSTTTHSTPLPPPHKIINYPLPDDPQGGALYIYGKSNSPTIAIFCAGYPDDHENGQIFCSRLSNESNTLVGLMCLPGYDHRPEKSWDTFRKDGYTFDEMTNAIREAVKVLRNESTHNKKAKLIGIFHDWGVVPGTIWTNRTLQDPQSDYPNEIILFDVLGPVHTNLQHDIPTPHHKQTYWEKFIEFYYRVVFATSFVLQRYVSKYVALLCFVIGTSIMNVLRIGPTLSIDDQVFKKRHVPLNPFRMIYMAYPYYYMFQTIIMFSNGRRHFHTFYNQMSIPKDLKQTPVLYLYGTNKRIMFHDDGAVKYLQRERREGRSKSDAIAVENAGHWLYIQQPDLCLKKVIEFMSK